MEAATYRRLPEQPTRPAGPADTHTNERHDKMSLQSLLGVPCPVNTRSFELPKLSTLFRAGEGNSASPVSPGAPFSASVGGRPEHGATHAPTTPSLAFSTAGALPMFPTVESAASRGYSTEALFGAVTDPAVAANAASRPLTGLDTAASPHSHRGLHSASVASSDNGEGETSSSVGSGRRKSIRDVLAAGRRGSNDGHGPAGGNLARLVEASQGVGPIRRGRSSVSVPSDPLQKPGPVVGYDQDYVLPPGLESFGFAKLLKATSAPEHALPHKCQHQQCGLRFSSTRIRDMHMVHCNFRARDPTPATAAPATDSFIVPTYTPAPTTYIPAGPTKSDDLKPSSEFVAALAAKFQVKVPASFIAKTNPASSAAPIAAPTFLESASFSVSTVASDSSSSKENPPGFTIKGVIVNPYDKDEQEAAKLVIPAEAMDKIKMLMMMGAEKRNLSF